MDTLSLFNLSAGTRNETLDRIARFVLLFGRERLPRTLGSKRDVLEKVMAIELSMCRNKIIWEENFIVIGRFIEIGGFY